VRVYGAAFTSVPGRAKPIHVAACWLDDDILRFERIQSFGALEASLRQPGPWIAGFDFPFTQARRFTDNIGWPQEWGAFADHVGAMSARGFPGGARSLQICSRDGRSGASPEV
jgi:hypothetical protein